MEFNVLVGLTGFFFILASIGLTCINDVAQNGGLIFGVIFLILGIILLYSGMLLL